MVVPNLSYMFQALTRLEKAVTTAANSISQNRAVDEKLTKRVSMYQEVIRRQYMLLAQLEKAAKNKNWKEVSRLTSLIHGASLLVKVDADFLLSAVRGATEVRSGA